MSAILLMTSSCSMRNYLSRMDDNEPEMEYMFVYEDLTKHPWESGSTQNWTHLFPKEWPYTSLKEGDIFHLNDGLHDKETYKVRVVKSGQIYNKKYFKVWFHKI